MVDPAAASPRTDPDLGLPPIRPRTPLGQPRFALWANLGATLAAFGAYVLAVTTAGVPPPSLSVALFASAPVCAVLALPVLVGRGRRDEDAAVAWFAVGVAVTAVSLTLQFIAFPSVATDGGPLGTDAQATAALYLAYHLALPAGALAGAMGASLRWRLPVLAVAVALVLVVAAAPLPLPTLLGDGDSYTGLLEGADGLLLVLAVVAIVVWALRAGRGASELRGWIGLTMSLAAVELFLNMLADQRFSHVWWASASLRAATFVVLLGGSIHYLMTRLGRVEDYGERELQRRESELVASHSVSDALLHNAQRLALCLTPDQVANTLGTSVKAVVPDVTTTVYQLDQPRDRMVLLAGDPVEGMTEFPLGAAGHVPEATAAGAAAFSVDGVHPSAVLPLVVGGLGIGSLVLTGPAVEDPVARTLLRGLADQAATALSRSRLYERERTAAATLQRALLPQRLPHVEGLDLATCYQPATVGARVGGDWFDCQVLADGRVALLVGDVVGKGLRAAGVMGQFRSAFQALVSVDPAPGVVLERLNAIAAGRGDEMAATVVYVLLDVDARTARVARAGHLPALVVGADGDTRFVDEGGGPPLGVLDTAYAEVCVPLPPATTIVLCTDGLVEDRRASLGEGLDRLRQAASAAVGGGEDASTVAQHLLEVAPEAGEDDVALLVATVLG